MSQVKFVARGVDTLLLNVYYMDEQEHPVKRDLSYELIERLDVWKQGAIEAEGRSWCRGSLKGAISRCTRKVRVVDSGASCSRGRLNCVAMVRCSSEYLWSCQNMEVAIVQVNAFSL